MTRCDFRDSFGREHFIELDSIRGIAALSVALTHIRGAWLPGLSAAYVLNSYLMVDLFFVLSGFVIFHSSYQKIADARSAGRFMWLRFWRLYPLHLAILLLFSVMDLAKLLAIHSGHSPRTAYNVPFGGDLGAFAKTFIANGLLVQDLPWLQLLGRGAFPGDVNVPAWSISCEFYTYMIFSVVVLSVGFQRRALAIFLAIALAAGGALAAIADGGINSSAGYFGVLRCLSGFFGGAATAVAYRYIRSQNIFSLGVFALVGIVGFFAFVAIDNVGHWDVAVYPLAAGVILLTALSSGGNAISILRIPLMRWLGTISYSIYLTHYFVIKIGATAIRFLFHLQFVKLAGENLMVLDPGPVLGAGATLVAIAVILSVSDFTYRTIEKPFRDWSRNHFAKKVTTLGMQT
jgi:peptidoglycan/LPS O-acetylase OafA/YrhL